MIFSNDTARSTRVRAGQERAIRSAPAPCSTPTPQADVALTTSDREADEASMDTDCAQDRFDVTFTAILLEVLDDLRDHPEVHPVRMLPRTESPWFNRYRALSPGKQGLQVDEGK